MLGSASELLELTEDDRTVRLCFSGDLGRKDLPILRDPEPMPAADYLILESTYGGRTHPPITNVDDELCEAIVAANERGGKVVIPAFAVGRTQEILYLIRELEEEKRIPVLPVVVDSPMAAQAQLQQQQPELTWTLPRPCTQCQPVA